MRLQCGRCPGFISLGVVAAAYFFYAMQTHELGRIFAFPLLCDVLVKSVQGFPIDDAHGGMQASPLRTFARLMFSKAAVDIR
ncbi:hypothetical protein A9974_20750 [Achromobacter sp. UMC71]|nr:hypothetical protein [Achromobacter sp. UMC71]